MTHGCLELTVESLILPFCCTGECTEQRGEEDWPPGEREHGSYAITAAGRVEIHH
jgi:hypothetical protein